MTKPFVAISDLVLSSSVENGDILFSLSWEGLPQGEVESFILNLDLANNMGEARNAAGEYFRDKVTFVTTDEQGNSLDAPYLVATSDFSFSDFGLTSLSFIFEASAYDPANDEELGSYSDYVTGVVVTATGEEALEQTGDIQIDANQITENSAEGTVVGHVSSDGLEGAELIYTLVEDGDGKFAIDENGQITLVGSLDVEAHGIYHLVVSISDGVTTVHDVVTVAVADVNDAVTGAVLEGETINSAALEGEVVGLLTAIDPDRLDEHSFALTDDADGLFRLEVMSIGDKFGAWLVANRDLSASDAGAQSVKVEVTDAGGEVAESTLDVTVTNEAPDDIGLSKTNVLESHRTNFVFATLSGDDPEGDALTYILVAGQGDNDGYFRLVTLPDGSTGVQLRQPLDFEARQNYSLVVEARDEAGNVTRQTLTVKATDAQVKFSGAGAISDYNERSVVIEGAKAGTTLGFFDDFEAKAKFVKAKVLTGEDAFALKQVKLENGQSYWHLVTTKPLDHEAADQLTVKVRFWDKAGKAYTKTMKVDVADRGEVGDPSRGMITLDASGASKGVNWDTWFQTHRSDGSVPTFVGSDSTMGTSTTNPAEGVLFGQNGGQKVYVGGENIVYNWADALGQSLHVVSGTVTSIGFGQGQTVDGDTNGVPDGFDFSDLELLISGLDLTSGNSFDDHMIGDVHHLVSGIKDNVAGSNPAALAWLQAILADHAQNFIGSAFGDTYGGTRFGDSVAGGGGADKLRGAAGADTIIGGAGNDLVAGQAGQDVLTGGAGRDAFRFERPADSRPSAFDRITDFKAGEDVIDLRAIDANAKLRGNQSFDFIGSKGFTKKAGQLRVEKVGGETFVDADVNGDGRADFSLVLEGNVTLREGYFLL
jgi:Ca2+-binding RTX toxin-like protein